MIWTLLFLVSLVTHSVICDLSAGGGHHHHHGDHSHGDHHDHDPGHGHHGHNHDEHHGHHSDDKKATSGITEHVKKGQLKLPNIKASKLFVGFEIHLVEMKRFYISNDFI